MARLEITDHCLTPDRAVTLNYSGPDPWGVSKKIAGTLKPHFHVSTSGLRQPIVNWDISKDPITFYTVWIVKRNMSRFSHMMIEIKVQGRKTKADNRGEFILELRGEIVTNFEGANIFLKSVWAMYSYLFYSRRRARYIDICRDLIIGFRNDIKEHFNLKFTHIRGLRGAPG